LVKIQSLVKGFLQRLQFYEDMKVKEVKLENQTLKRNLIAYKLGRISKKQIDRMKKERAGVEEYMKHMSNETKSAEALIEEFLPNVERIFRERASDLSNLKMKIEETTGKKMNYRWQKVYEKAVNRGD
jgi:predicted nuclease with TOPRIM domain